MKHKFYSIVVTVLALALLLTSDFGPATSGAQRAAAAAGVGYVNVPAAAFTPIGPGGGYLNNGFELEVYDDLTFVAPVHLPHGATLTKLTLYYSDSNPTEDCVCKMRAMDTATFLYNQGISDEVKSSGTGQDTDFTTIFHLPTVDNSRYFYFVDCTLYHDGTFSANLYGIRIEYTYPVYMPVTVK